MSAPAGQHNVRALTRCLRYRCLKYSIAGTNLTVPHRRRVLRFGGPGTSATRSFTRHLGEHSKPLEAIAEGAADKAAQLVLEHVTNFDARSGRLCDLGAGASLPGKRSRRANVFSLGQT
jgi:DNA-binding GntR family transcriptional regulator